MSVPIELLSNLTYLKPTMRNLLKSETTLTDFLIFSLEEAGEEKFKLFCLNSTLFNLNNEHRKCAQNEILELPSSNWVLKNDFGTFLHFHHNFHLKQMHQINTSWEDLTDTLMVLEFELTEPALQPIDEQPNISWITDNNGDISNEGHYTFYSLMGVAIFLMFIITCFHSEIRKICACMIPARQFQPEIVYRKDPEQLIISQQALTPIERSIENRDGQQSELPPNDPIISRKMKGAAADQILKCPGPAAQTPVLCAPTGKVKTTNIKNISDSASAETARKGTVRFAFPNVKRQEKT